MHDRSTAFRIADANWNRVMEGLRTLEDIARFSNHSSPQQNYKSLRHALQEACRDWDRSEWFAARNAEEDVGRTVKQPSELNRANGLADIAAAAAGRCEQGLRVLEEMAKFLYPTTATNVESIRYRAYDLNASLLLSLWRDIDFLNRAQLYVLVDCQLPHQEFVHRIGAISEAGVDLIQIRDKSADAIQILNATQAAVDAVGWDRTRIIVNDRIDIANCSPAWGAHVGQEDIPTNAARRMLAGHQVLGLSTHSIEQIEKALEASVDYIGCGPTFPSKTKAFDSFAGLEFLERAAKLLRERGSSMPAFAIGGIGPENLPQVLEAGFDRIAVSSCVWKSENPGRVAEEIKKVLEKSRGGRAV